jgi:hypothetical protein
MPQGLFLDSRRQMVFNYAPRRKQFSNQQKEHDVRADVGKREIWECLLPPAE